MKRLGILFCLLSVTGFAAGPPKLLDGLRAKFQAEVKALHGDISPKDQEMLSRIEPMFSDSWTGGFRDRARPSGRYADIVEALMELEATTRSDKVDALCETIITEMRGVVPKTTREFRENFMPMVREAFIAGLSATSPKEIDSSLVTLAGLQKQMSDLEGSFSDVVQITRQILTTYQNGLLGLEFSEDGRKSNPSRELAEIASRSQLPALFGDIMPRSEFMEKMRVAAAKVASGPEHPQNFSAKSFDEKTLDLVNGIKTLDDMSAVVVQIEAIRARDRALRNFSSDSLTVRLLREYALAYERLRADGTLSIYNLTHILDASLKDNPSLGGQPISKLGDMLFRYALPRVLGAPPDLAPKEGESTADFLQRARATARATSNWKLYRNILEYGSKGPNDISRSGIGAFHYFMAALNLEAAGQRSEAVKSYRNALNAGAQDIPLDYIREHLEAIRKNFPQDYADASKTESSPRNAATPFRQMPPQREPPLVPNKIAPTVADIHYTGRHERQVLDFYRAKSDKPTPLMFYVHGGGWAAGDKNNPDGLQECLDAGISVVSINYRYIVDANLTGVTPPVKAPMEDAARALQFVRSMAGEWNIDKERIGAVGGSAGACTSLWLAYHPDMADPKGSDPVSHESTRVWCAAVFVPQTTLDPQQMKEWTPNSDYGYHAFHFFSFADYLTHREQILPWIAEYSPYALVTKDAPPVYLFYGEPPALGKPQKDPTHTANFGVKLQEHCKELGVPCELMYPGAPNVKHPGGPIQYLIERLKVPSAKSGL